MKFFAYFFLGLTLVCGYFWATDAPGSGMVYPTVGFASIAGGVMLYNKRKTGSFFNNSSAGR
jgi:hypothetical protein